MFCPNCNSINLEGKITFNPCVSTEATVDCYQTRDKNDIFQWYSKGVWKTLCFPTSALIHCNDCFTDFENPGKIVDKMLNARNEIIIEESGESGEVEQSIVNVPQTTILEQPLIIE